MLTIKSAQFMGYNSPRLRNSIYRIMGKMADGSISLASPDTYLSIGEAKSIGKKYLDEFRESGFVELWVSEDYGSDVGMSDRIAKIWVEEDEPYSEII